MWTQPGPQSGDCPLCHDWTWRRVWGQIVQCGKCGHRYTLPPPPRVCLTYLPYPPLRLTEW